MVQGQNRFASPFIGMTDTSIIHRYAGSTPPDRNHVYTLTLYALDTMLDVEDGYQWNDFYKKIDGNVMATVTEPLVVLK